jgi:hypothetical protein
VGTLRRWWASELLPAELALFSIKFGNLLLQLSTVHKSKSLSALSHGGTKFAISWNPSVVYHGMIKQNVLLLFFWYMYINEASLFPEGAT